MTRSPAIVPREELTPQFLCASVLDRLVEVFLFFFPESNRDDFLEFYYPMTRREFADGDEAVKFWKDQNKGELSSRQLVLISCSYCCQVEAANAMDNQDLAKSCLVDAHFYLGMARAAMSSAPQVAHLKESVAKEARSTNAKHSVSVRNDPWQKTKEEAMRLIRELAKAGCRWATPSEAARTIAEDVAKFLSNFKPKKQRGFQGLRQREVRIAKWLREMPEAAELFASLRK